MLIPYSGRKEFRRFMREQQCRWFGHKYLPSGPEIEEDLKDMTYTRYMWDECCRTFDMDTGEQIENWAWEKRDGEFVRISPLTGEPQDV